MDFIVYVISILIIAVLVLYVLYSTQRKKVLQLQSLHDELSFKNRSQSVKHGQHWEQFVPFMPDFEKIATRENFFFLGKPIDGISFDENAIKFIEIKTGKSRLNDKQKHIKDLVQNKKIEWHELRF